MLINYAVHNLIPMDSIIFTPRLMGRKDWQCIIYNTTSLFPEWYTFSTRRWRSWWQHYHGYNDDDDDNDDNDDNDNLGQSSLTIMSLNHLCWVQFWLSHEDFMMNSLNSPFHSSQYNIVNCTPSQFNLAQAQETSVYDNVFR